MTTTLSSILPQNTKYDFFQTQTHVILSIYLKNIDEQSVTSQFKSHSLSLTISNSLPLTDTTNLLDLKTDLFAQIDPLSSVVTCLKTRVEVKMLKKKNWDKLAVEMDDGKEDESGLNSMFQHIFKSGDDDTRKAMMKSFSESGGTCLSTDWKDIGSKTTAVTPPEGMEAHYYK